VNELDAAAVADYRAAAARYVALFERSEADATRDPDALIAEIGLALADLYAAGARIPEVELSEEDVDVPGDAEMTTQRFFQAIMDIATVIDEAFDWAWLEQFNDLERDAVLADVSNDLSETYDDVRDHLAMLARGERQSEPSWSSPCGRPGSGSGTTPAITPSRRWPPCTPTSMQAGLAR